MSIHTPPPLTHTHSLCVYRTWEQGEHGRGKRWAEGESQGDHKGRVLQKEAEEWPEVLRGSWGSWHLAGLLPQLPVPGPGRGRDQKDNRVRRGLQKADWPRSGGRRGLPWAKGGEGTGPGIKEKGREARVLTGDDWEQDWGRVSVCRQRKE